MDPHEYEQRQKDADIIFERAAALLAEGMVVRTEDALIGKTASSEEALEAMTDGKGRHKTKRIRFR